jgi:polysaccharide chain length determinant protein (PEP-CTERM system associated)
VNPLVTEVLDEVRGAWRFRWLAFATATVLALVGWVAVFSLPDRYEAEARVFVDTRTPLRPVLQGLTVEEDVDAEINFVRESLLAGPQLERIAREAELLPAYPIDPHVQEQLLTGLSQRIEIEAHSASGREEERNTAGTIYRIVYQGRNRARTLRVVGILLDTFVNETLGGKREGSETAQQFLLEQLRDYEKRLRAAEESLADFKKKHIGLMPNEQGGYFAELQSEHEKVTDLKAKLTEAESRRATLLRQLHGDVAVAAAASAERGPGSTANDTLSRIDAAQAHLDELLLRFTDRHPDVIAARQALDDLKKRRAAEIESLRQGDAAAAASSRASSNPVYQNVQLRLNETDVEIADLHTQLTLHEAKATELRSYLNTAPQVEAEFAQLNRDYDVNKAEYTALLDKLQKTRIGERADTAGSVRFEIVQPPTASLRPVWPKRPLLIAETLLAALGAGAALAYGLQYLRPVVTSASALTEAVGVPVLGQVSVAFPEQARSARRRELLRISVASGCLALVCIGVFIVGLQGYRLSLTALRQLVNM